MKIVFVGGDARTVHAAEYLKKQGHTVSHAFFGAPGAPEGDCDVAVLPLPCERGGLLNAPFYERKVTVAEALSYFSGDTLMLGSHPLLDRFDSVNYAEREDFTSKNAVCTVEAALSLATARRADTFSGARTVVLGFGRIGARLSHLLRELGADVTVAIRNGRVRSAASALGYGTVGFESLEAPFTTADAVFSTVPEAVVDGRQARALPSDTLVFELASLEGGFTHAAKEILGERLITARGLPGKITPVAAGRALGETVESIISEGRSAV